MRRKLKNTKDTEQKGKHKEITRKCFARQARRADWHITTEMEL